MAEMDSTRSAERLGTREPTQEPVPAVALAAEATSAVLTGLRSSPSMSLRSSDPPATVRLRG